MKNERLENRIFVLGEFIELWESFHNVMKEAGKGAPIDAESGSQFLELKSSIARKLQALSDIFGENVMPEEDITDILSESVSIEHMAKVGSLSSSNMENTWHRTHIALNKILGSLENDRDELEKVSAVGAWGKRLLANRVVTTGLVLVCIMTLYWLIAAKFVKVGADGEGLSSFGSVGALTAQIYNGIVGHLPEKARPDGAWALGAFSGSNVLFYLLFGFFGGAVSLIYARKKGKNPLLWGVLGFALFLLLACIILLITPIGVETIPLEEIEE